MNHSVQFHDQIAHEWESKYKKNTFHSRELVLSACLEGVSLSSTRWLDAGCGTGTLTRWLAQRGSRVTGVDAAPRMVSVAQELSQNSPGGDRTSFVCISSIEKMDLPDASFEGVLCSSVLEYLANPRAALAEFYRILEPGGILLVSVPNKRSVIRGTLVAASAITRRLLSRPWPPFLEHSVNSYSQAEFTHTLGAIGFATQQVIFFGGVSSLSLQRQRWIGSLMMFKATKSLAPAPTRAGLVDNG